MQTYSNTQLVQATPMTQEAFIRYNGGFYPKTSPAEESFGFLVEDSKGISNHKDHKGRIQWLSDAEFLADHVDLGDISEKPKYHQRMVGELAELSLKLLALQRYTKTDQFLKLVFVDRDLLQEQCRMMTRYSDVLTERILRYGV